MIGVMSIRLLALALCAAVGAGAAVAAEREVVSIGTANASPDGGFYIAAKRGYFSAEGIDVTFVSFDSAARMVAPLATNAGPASTDCIRGADCTAAIPPAARKLLIHVARAAYEASGPRQARKTAGGVP